MTYLVPCPHLVPFFASSRLGVGSVLLTFTVVYGCFMEVTQHIINKREIEEFIQSYSEHTHICIVSFWQKMDNWCTWKVCYGWKTKFRLSNPTVATEPHTATLQSWRENAPFCTTKIRTVQIDSAEAETSWLLDPSNGVKFQKRCILNFLWCNSIS